MPKRPNDRSDVALTPRPRVPVKRAAGSLSTGVLALAASMGCSDSHPAPMPSGDSGVIAPMPAPRDAGTPEEDSGVIAPMPPPLDSGVLDGGAPDASGTDAGGPPPPMVMPPMVEPGDAG